MGENYQDRLDGVRQCTGLLHAAQKEFYASGSADRLQSVLTHDVVWSVPGRNAIAGRYEEIENVIAYFARRRDISARTLSMQTHALLVGQGDFVAALTDGRATLDGVHRQWSTVGVYQLRDGRVAACCATAARLRCVRSNLAGASAHRCPSKRHADDVAAALGSESRAARGWPVLEGHGPKTEGAAMYKALVRARVRRGIQRLNEGNAEFVLGLAVPDVELAFPGDNSWAAMYRPVKKSRERHVTHRGVAEVRAFAQRFIAAGIQYQIDEILVNGPPWNTRVTMRAVDWVVGPDGADTYNNRMVSFLALRWGKIVSWEVYGDTQRVTAWDEALGAGATE
jgi:ketosteroid isomerase-like protein